jgi:hypothetical protein
VPSSKPRAENRPCSDPPCNSASIGREATAQTQTNSLSKILYAVHLENAGGVGEVQESHASRSTSGSPCVSSVIKINCISFSAKSISTLRSQEEGGGEGHWGVGGLADLEQTNGGRYRTLLSRKHITSPLQSPTG